MLIKFSRQWPTAVSFVSHQDSHFLHIPAGQGTFQHHLTSWPWNSSSSVFQPEQVSFHMHWAFSPHLFMEPGFSSALSTLPFSPPPSLQSCQACVPGPMGNLQSSFLVLPSRIAGSCRSGHPLLVSCWHAILQNT